MLDIISMNIYMIKSIANYDQSIANYDQSIANYDQSIAKYDLYLMCVKKLCELTT